MSTKKSNRTAIALGCSVAAFIAFMGFTFFSVNNIASTVDAAVVANKNGLPVSWDSLAKVDSTSSITSARVINDDYVQYTTYLKNTDKSSTLALTHIASYVDANDDSGFVPLSERNLEYTYDPSDSNSWTPVTISKPGNMSDNFKLSYPLFVGAADSNTDTVYFRYNVSPREAGTVSDKVAFVTENESGVTALTTSDSSIAFAENSGNEVVAVVDPSDESGEYTAPLGAFSETPSSTIINAATLGSINISPDSLNASIIIMIATLAIFACSLIVYMVIRGKSKSKRA